MYRAVARNIIGRTANKKSQEAEIASHRALPRVRRKAMCRAGRAGNSARGAPHAQANHCRAIGCRYLAGKSNHAYGERDMAGATITMRPLSSPRRSILLLLALCRRVDGIRRVQ